MHCKTTLKMRIKGHIKGLCKSGWNLESEFKVCKNTSIIQFFFILMSFKNNIAFLLLDRAHSRTFKRDNHWEIGLVMYHFRGLLLSKFTLEKNLTETEHVFFGFHCLSFIGNWSVFTRGCLI